MISKGKRLRKIKIEGSSGQLTPDMFDQIFREARRNAYLRYLLALIAFIAGVLLIIFDVNREGMILRMTIGNNVIEYVGTYVGVVFFLGGILITLFTRLSISVKIGQ